MDIWVQFEDEDGDAYYWSPLLSATTRERPTGAVRVVTSKEYAALQDEVAVHAETLVRGEDDWQEFLDAEENVYYFSPSRNVSTWAKPGHRARVGSASSGAASPPPSTAVAIMSDATITAPPSPSRPSSGVLLVSAPAAATSSSTEVDSVPSSPPAIQPRVRSAAPVMQVLEERLLAQIHRTAAITADADRRVAAADVRAAAAEQEMARVVATAHAERDVLMARIRELEAALESTRSAHATASRRLEASETQLTDARRVAVAQKAAAVAAAVREESASPTVAAAAAAPADTAAPTRRVYMLSSIGRATSSGSSATSRTMEEVVVASSVASTPHSATQRSVLDAPSAASSHARLSFLKSVPVFHTLPEAQLSKLADSMTRTVFPAGHVIIREGDAADGFFYIIEMGRVHVHRRAAPAPSGEKLRPHAPSDPSTTRSEASAPGSPPLLARFSDELGDSSTSEESHTGVRSAAGGDEPRVDLRARGASGSDEDAGPNDAWSTLDEDEPVDAAVGPVVCELSKGMFFGDRALLTSEPRAATCIADGEVTCLALDRTAFDAALSSIGSFLGEYSRQNYNSDTRETMSLSRHVHSYHLLVDAAAAAGLDLDAPVERDGALPATRALVDIMAIFSQEIGVIPLFGRLKRVLKSVLDAEYVEVALLDASRGEVAIGSVAGYTKASPSGAPAAPTSNGGVSARRALLPSRETSAASASSVDPVDLHNACDALEELRGSACGNGFVRVPLATAGALGACITRSQMIVCNDISSDERFINKSSSEEVSWYTTQRRWDELLLVPDNTRSLICAPITDAAGHVIGALMVLNKMGGTEAETPSSPLSPTVEEPTDVSPSHGAASMPPASVRTSTALLTMAEGDEDDDEEDMISTSFDTEVQRPEVQVVRRSFTPQGARVSATPRGSGGAGQARAARPLAAMRTWSITAEASRTHRREEALRNAEGATPAARPRGNLSRGDSMTARVFSRGASLADAPDGSFKERDQDIVRGTAEALSMAFDDKSTEISALLGSRAFTPAHTVTRDISFTVIGIINVPVALLRLPGASSTKPDASTSAFASCKGVAAANAHEDVLGDTFLPELSSRPLSTLLLSVSVMHGRDVITSVNAELPALYATAGDPNVAAARVNAGISVPLHIADAPLAARIVLNVSLKDGTPLGWAAFSVYTVHQTLTVGPLRLPLWQGNADGETLTRVTALWNKFADSSVVPTLGISLPTIEPPVVKFSADSLTLPVPRVIPLEDAASTPRSGAPPSSKLGQRATVMEFVSFKGRLLSIIKQDPLYAATEEEMSLLWRCREFLTSIPEALPKFLHAVPWADAACVAEAHRLLLGWRPPSPLQALELLQARLPDPIVRAYAVSRLEMLGDTELHTLMLQLVQVLKFEPFLDSSLTRFLLRRSMRRPRTIGHVFFWFLKAEMHAPTVADRFGAVLQQYLLNCSEHRIELGHQLFVMAKLEEISTKVKSAANKEERILTLRSELPRVVFPERFQLPLSPHMMARGLIVDKCRVMSSKKLPLWLVFETGDASPTSRLAAAAASMRALPAGASAVPRPPAPRTISVLFKAGDDLRQDQLTLQILHIMSTLWAAEGLDLRLSPYRCVATGDELGMIEVVLNSNTLAGIVAESINSASSGITRKVRAALQVYSNDSVYREWLEKQPCNKDGMAAAEDNFVRSCAGYCVATYVLGIGDRHNDNLMLTQDGRLFHIDFGHFLGNFKSKMGYKRERAPFIFTPAFAAVMGGKGSEPYKRFESLSMIAYNVLRRHGHLLLNLFQLMLASGLPELQREKDLTWLRDKLMLNATNEEAAEHFRKQIKVSLNTRATQFNDAVHLLAHA